MSGNDRAPAAGSHEEWFDDLFRRHHVAIRSYALRRVPSEADDIVSEVFTVAWRNRDEVPDHPLPWLYAVAARPCTSVVAGVCVALGAGATASIATLVPADKIATPPLSSPTILNGSGPEDVALPDPPEGALYVHFWRLYAIYTDRLELDLATLEDGRTLGVPSHSLIPDLVPAETTTGEPGWIDYKQLTTGAAPRPGDLGPRPDPLPVYDADGHTVIGTADVDATYPSSP